MSSNARCTSIKSNFLKVKKLQTSIIMRTQSIIGATLVLATTFVSAAPANVILYATFYDDTACSVNGGEAVSLSNPGCLNESGRNSIYFQSGSNQSGVLIISPSPDCPCQNGCIYGVGAGEGDAAYCQNIDGTSNGPSGSFRFISMLSAGNKCPPDNC
jgi:hypothetical protein